MDNGVPASPWGSHGCATEPQASPPSVSIPNAEPIILVRADDPDRKPLLYACGKCGAVHSPRIYMCGEKLAHETARRAAEDCYTCRENNVCNYCGTACPKGWTACSDCRVSRKLEAATEIPDDGGPYFEFGGDRYYHDIESAADDGVEWVAPCKVTYPHISADNVLENLLDDMHEDASVDDLDGADAFSDAVDAFNKAQTTRSFWADETRKIRVPASGTEAGTGETQSGSISEADDGAVANGETPNV